MVMCTTELAVTFVRTSSVCREIEWPRLRKANSNNVERSYDLVVQTELQSTFLGNITLNIQCNEGILRLCLHLRYHSYIPSLNSSI